jgi:hypothetical protein
VHHSTRRSLSRLTKAHLAAGLALVVGIGVVGLLPSRAVADGTAPDYPSSVLHVSVTGPKVANRPVTIVASGSNQMTALGTPIDYGLYLFLVNPKLLPGPCATSEATEETNISNNTAAGRQLNYEQFNEGESGPFTIKVPFTPGGGGTLLVCAYSEYVTDDAAWASTEAVVTGGAPTNTVRPKLTRHGKRLTCARGSWSGQPSAYSYRWRLNGKTSPDKQNALTLNSKQHGSAVCTVTAKNASGSKSASSRPLKLV